MHLWRIAITASLFSAFTAHAAVVYKWTDADGVVHFSDQPVAGAEKIITASGTSKGISAGPRGSPTAAPAPPANRLALSEFTIASPAREQVFFADEVVPVRLNISGLQPTQRIVWNLNGAPLTDQGPDASAFVLSGLARGAYEITATVTDGDTGDTRTTDPVTFYVRQPSALAPLDPQRKK